MSLLKEIDRIFIQWEVAGKQLLTIFLSRSGSINRMGGADPEQENLPLVMGNLGEASLFEAALQLIDESWLSNAGRYELPDPKGAICVLSIGLEGESLDTGFSFTYGMDSEGPPDEFVAIVEAAIEATDAWYLEQVSRKKQRRKKGG